MKKICIFLFLCLLLFPFKVKANDDLIPGARSGLLMDINSGEILFEKDKDTPYAVASMTKMMSQILILEAIEDGKLNWDKKVKVSSNAAGFGGSQIYLQPGEEMTVEDIFKGISMASANDGTVALAEEVAGTEENFVKMMNDKAKELGLKNTVFKNSTGLDEEGHVSSSYDMALIARHLILEHPKILEFSSVYEDYLREDTPNKFWLVNTNKLVRFFDGADGLKTGHTDAARYCMAVTAKRGNMRLLAVVLGEETAAIRNQETTNLLNYGFDNYTVNLLKTKNEIIETKTIDKANKDKINIILKEDVVELLKKGSDSKNYEFKTNINEFKFPIKKGDNVGTLDVIDNGKVIKKADLTVDQDIDKLNIISLYGKYLKGIITGFNN